MGRPAKSTGRRKIDSGFKLECLSCGTVLGDEEYYGSNSRLYLATKKLPYCNDCINKMYRETVTKYLDQKVEMPERKAIERLCMSFDWYYNDKVFEEAYKDSRSTGGSVVNYYVRRLKMKQNLNKTYDTTIFERQIGKVTEPEPVEIEEQISQSDLEKAVRIFGVGFSKDDYKFLFDQYIDWTTRHECETKSQEEIFKQICFTQLDLFKARRAGDDTKDLNVTLMKQLDVAKLQPKQNRGDSASEAQTLGTLIDKWETTRPLPEIDEDLRDVDQIGRYLDVFFRGHLAKMMGLKNGISRIYEKYIEKYSAKKPEYKGEEDSDALFDAIFGSGIDEE